MEKRLTLFLACLLMSLRVAFAQVDVSGTVISQDDGEPVIGASVVVYGGGQNLQEPSRISMVSLN